MSVPSDWKVRSGVIKPNVFSFRAEPASGPGVVALITLRQTPADEVLRPDQLKEQLLLGMKEKLGKRSVEKVFEAQPLRMAQGAGWVAQFTEAELVGRPSRRGEYKVMRSAFAALDDHMMVFATILFDDPGDPEVERALSLLATLRLERAPAPGAAGARSTRPFTFTVPDRRVVVSVGDPALEPLEVQGQPSQRFQVARRDPLLVLSGWLEPASGYAALPDEEPPAAAEARRAEGGGPRARVEKLRVGPWEVLAYDFSVPGGETSAHVHARCVVADTWIDLHLSTRSAGPPAALREQLLTALRRVEVVEKGASPAASR